MRQVVLGMLILLNFWTTVAAPKSCLEVLAPQPPNVASRIRDAVVRTSQRVGLAAFMLSVPASPFIVSALARGGSISGGGFAKKTSDGLTLIDLIYPDSIPFTPEFHDPPNIARLIPTTLSDDQRRDGWKIDLRDFAGAELQFALEKLAVWKQSSPAMIEMLKKIIFSDIWYANDFRHNAFMNQPFAEDVSRVFMDEAQDLVLVASNNISTKRIFINPYTWVQLDKLSRATLLVHEAYRFLNLLSSDISFDDNHRAVIGHLMKGNPSSREENIFEMYFNDLWIQQRQLNSPLSFLRFPGTEEVHDEPSWSFSPTNSVVRHRHQLAEEFRKNILQHPWIHQNSSHSNEQIELRTLKKLYQNSRAEGWIRSTRIRGEGVGIQREMEKAESLRDIPIEVLGYWILRAIRVDFYWREFSALNTSGTTVASLLAAHPSLLTQSVINELLRRFVESGQQFEKDGSMNLFDGKEFFVAGALLRELYQALNRDEKSVSPDLISRFQ